MSMGIHEFKLPDIGEGVVEGEIVAWHVKVGDSIKEDDPILEISTDKGKTWKLAILEGNKQPLTPVRFRFNWNWEGQECSLQSRATDSSKNKQPIKV